MVTISGKALGRKKPLFADFSIAFPPDLREGGDRLTLRDLISRVVRDEVAAFRQRQEERKLIRALTAKQINEGAEKGKIDMGGRDLDQCDGDIWHGRNWSALRKKLRARHNPDYWVARIARTRDRKTTARLTDAGGLVIRISRDRRSTACAIFTPNGLHLEAQGRTAHPG